MAVASVWRRRWPWRVSSSTAPQLQLGGLGGDYGEGYSLEPTYGYGGSTTSGTTTYTTTTTTGTSNSGGGEGRREFHPSATTVVATAPVVEEDAEDLDDVDEEEDSAKKKKLERIKSLVMEFHGGNNLSAVGRWLRELQVGWVLLLGETAESTAGRILVFYSKSWILALQEISESISRCVVDGWRNQQQDDQGTSKHHPPAAASSSEFAQLVEATVLKMLPFVDIAVAAATHTHRPGPAAEEKLQVLVDLHEALSTASEHILPLLTDDCKTTRALLSADMTRLGKAICDTIVEVRNCIMASLDGRSGSMGIIIHEATRSVTSYAKVLWLNHGLLNRILDDAVRRGEHVCFENENVSYLTNLIIDMVRSLEDQLATKSQSWFSSDLQGLRFLFLINNCYFIFQELQASSQWRLAVHLSMPDLAQKIDDYIDCYLQVSWSPVLKCLQAPPPATPRCFTRYYSPPLRKFVSRFHKTYAAQKLWKVPDPEMRKRLRKAVIDKVVTVFARFLEDNNIDVDAPGVVTTLTPRKVEKMLGELFEG